MNDELLKKQLQKLLSNPGMTSLEDIELEQPNMEDSLAQKIESPDGDEYEEQPELAQAAKAVAAKSDANLAALPSAMPKEKPYALPSDITEKLKKLRDGEPMEAEEIDVTPAVIDDATAPVELRKAAMQKVRNKYLGR